MKHQAILAFANIGLNYRAKIVIKLALNWISRKIERLERDYIGDLRSIKMPITEKRMLCYLMCDEETSGRLCAASV